MPHSSALHMHKPTRTSHIANATTFHSKQSAHRYKKTRPLDQWLRKRSSDSAVNLQDWVIKKNPIILQMCSYTTSKIPGTTFDSQRPRCSLIYPQQMSRYLGRFFKTQWSCSQWYVVKDIMWRNARWQSQRSQVRTMLFTNRHHVLLLHVCKYTALALQQVYGLSHW